MDRRDYRLSSILTQIHADIVQDCLSAPSNKDVTEEFSASRYERLVYEKKHPTYVYVWIGIRGKWSWGAALLPVRFVEWLHETNPSFYVQPYFFDAERWSSSTEWFTVDQSDESEKCTWSSVEYALMDDYYEIEKYYKSPYHQKIGQHMPDLISLWKRSVREEEEGTAEVETGAPTEDKTIKERNPEPTMKDNGFSRAQLCSLESPFPGQDYINQYICEKKADKLRLRGILEKISRDIRDGTVQYAKKGEETLFVEHYVTEAYKKKHTTHVKLEMGCDCYWYHGADCVIPKDFLKWLDETNPKFESHCGGGCWKNFEYCPDDDYYIVEGFVDRRPPFFSLYFMETLYARWEASVEKSIDTEQICASTPEEKKAKREQRVEDDQPPAKRMRV